MPDSTPVSNLHDDSDTVYRDAVALPVPDTDALRFLPEGPIPLGVPNGLSWVGIAHGGEVDHGSINILDLATHHNESYDLHGRPGFAFACTTTEPNAKPTRFVAGVERSLGIFDTTSRTWQPFCDSVDHNVENTIINDGLVFEDNLIFGTKDLEFANKKAGLYLFRGRDRKLIQLRDDQVCSNGKMVRTDPATGQLKLIDIDSPTRLIVQYDLDIDVGTIGPAEVLVDLTREPGVPDGAILTPAGDGIIVSIFLPTVEAYGQTRWYDFASGALRAVWRTPGSPQNTCPALVAVNGTVRLVITTAIENMSQSDREQCPQAGQLFIGETDFTDPSAISIPTYPG